MSEAFDPLAFIEQTQQAVSAITGVKQQFIDAGWNEHNAERATIALLAVSSANKS